MRMDVKETNQMVFEPFIIFGNCALPIKYQPALNTKAVQRRLKKFGEIVGFTMPIKPDYRVFGKYKVKEIFAGEESLTSLLTQYVERTVAMRY